MHVFKWCLVWLVLYHSVDSKASGKIQTFKNSKKIPAFGLFYDKKPPTWERGHIVGYSLNSAKGEFYFQSKSRKSPSIFPYPSLINNLYLDKIPKWSELTVGKTVLVEFTPGKFQTGKIIARTNSTATGRNRDGGYVKVKKSKRTKTFDYRNARIKGMDVCRYFEIECDTRLEDCQLIYLNNWLPVPAQYKCSCKKGFKKHPTRGCIALKPTGLPSAQKTGKKGLKTTVKVDEQLEPGKSTSLFTPALKLTGLPSTQTTVKKGLKTTVKVDEQLEPGKSTSLFTPDLKLTGLPSTQTTAKEELKTTVKVDKQLEPGKSSVGVILGSLSACLVVIMATGIVLWKNFPRRLSSEERLRRMVIKEMEETWEDENTDVQEKTLLTKLSNHLQRCSAKLKDHFVSLIQKLREKASVYKKADSSETAIEKSSSENLRNEIRKEFKVALVRKMGNNIE